VNPIDVLTILRNYRSNEVVVATMGAEREWLKLSQHPRDFYYVPSSMGQAPTLGLGLAIARPDLRVVVLNGDGCMLMNLGCLVTIAEQQPSNYALVVFNNGVYEVTGAQPVAGSGRVDFAAMARAAGIHATSHFRDISSWKAIAPRILRGPGLEFAVIDVEPITSGEVSPKAPCPMNEQVARFRSAIGELN
jgi:thiamine pyrophosphate-dependent acetolactate synthase large subunit-like protein